MSVKEKNDQMSDILTALSDRDVIKFIAYLAIIIALAYPLMSIVARSWGTGLMEQSADAIRTMSQSGISFFTNITVGFLAGSTILLFFDRKKRVQAFILVVGIIATIYYMISHFSINWNVLYALLGAVLGIIAGGGYKKSNNYRQAALNISTISICYIIISYLNIYTLQRDQSSGNFFIDSTVILAFSYFFGSVMNYKGKGKRIFVLGPGKSGKTVFMVGCYKVALAKAESPTRPNRNLRDAFRQLHGRIDKKSKNDTLLAQSEWIDPPPREIKEYWPRSTEATEDPIVYEFIYETGTLFPKEVLFRTIDYPGGYLGNLSDNMYKRIDKNIDRLTSTYVKIAKEITISDKLIFVLDSETYPIFDYITHYIDIINILREKRKEFDSYIVVTKSDIFKEEFGRRPSDNDYEKFKEFVEKKFSKNDYVRMLFVESSMRDIRPVFYDTERDEHGTLKPSRNIDGNIFIFGYDELMGILME